MYLVCTHHLHSIHILRVQFDAMQLGVETLPGIVEVSGYGSIASRATVEKGAQTHLSTQRRIYQVARSDLSVWSPLGQLEKRCEISVDEMIVDVRLVW